MITLTIHLVTQTLFVFNDKNVIKTYPVSTAKNGAGEAKDSYQTPRGWHIVRAKIGANAAINTIFVGRRPTGEIYSSAMREKYPDRDWILTRIFWLSGLELNKNRLGPVDTMQRFIYIHGSPDDVTMGVPGSKGCIRMRNGDLIELFEMVPVGSKVLIVSDNNFSI